MRNLLGLVPGKKLKSARILFPFFSFLFAFFFFYIELSLSISLLFIWNDSTDTDGWCAGTMKMIIDSYSIWLMIFFLFFFEYSFIFLVTLFPFFLIFLILILGHDYLRWTTKGHESSRWHKQLAYILW